MIPKGYRAREKAALERSRLRIATPEVRAQRAAVLFGEPVKTDNAEVSDAAKTERAKQADPSAHEGKQSDVQSAQGEQNKAPEADDSQPTVPLRETVGGHDELQSVEGADEATAPGEKGKDGQEQEAKEAEQAEDCAEHQDAEHEADEAEEHQTEAKKPGRGRRKQS